MCSVDVVNKRSDCSRGRGIGPRPRVLELALPGLFKMTAGSVEVQEIEFSLKLGVHGDVRLLGVGVCGYFGVAG